MKFTTGIKIFFCLGIILILAGSGFAEEKKKIAVLNMSANNLSAEYAKIARDFFEVELYKTRSFDLLERNRIEVILKEQGFSATGCVDTECAVKIGQILSVDMVAVGSISKTANMTVIVKFIDVAKGRVLYADSETVQKEEQIEEAVRLLAERSAREIPQENRAPAEISFTYGYYLRGLVPGWGQFYAGRNTKGWLYLGSFTLSGSFAVWGYFNYRSKKDAYDNLGADSSMREFNEKYDEYNTAVLFGRISLGVLALAYIINYIDILFFTDPLPVKERGQPEDGNVRFSTFSVMVLNRYSGSVYTNEDFIECSVRFSF